MAKSNKKQEQAPAQDQAPGEGATENAQQQSADGLLVTVGIDEWGEMTLGVQTVGNTSVMEAPTILDLASKRVRKQLGI